MVGDIGQAVAGAVTQEQPSQQSSGGSGTPASGGTPAPAPGVYATPSGAGITVIYPPMLCCGGCGCGSSGVTGTGGESGGTPGTPVTASPAPSAGAFTSSGVPAGLQSAFQNVAGAFGSMAQGGPAGSSGFGGGGSSSTADVLAVLAAFLGL